MLNVCDICMQNQCGSLRILHGYAAELKWQLEAIGPGLALQRNASDDNCSEASSIYTSSCSDDECDAVTGCKTFTIVKDRQI